MKKKKKKTKDKIKGCFGGFYLQSIFTSEE